MTAVLSTRHCALAVVVAAIGFGTTGTVQTFAPAGAEPLSVGAIRLLVGGLLLTLIGGVRYYRHVGRTRPRFTTGFWWVLLGAGSVMAYQATFFAGRTGWRSGRWSRSGRAHCSPGCSSGWASDGGPPGAGRWPPAWRWPAWCCSPG